MDATSELIVEGVRFRRRGAALDVEHGCDAAGRVPAGGGFWSGDPHADLCTTCWELVRAEPHRAPSDEEAAQLARVGVLGDAPWFATVGEDVEGDVARLEALVEARQLVRVALDQTPRLGAWLEAGGVLPEGAVVRRDGVGMRLGTSSVAEIELAVRGEGGVPPIDPELQARLDAAADEQGVIRDPALADEYFAALQAQGEEMRRRRGWPEPVIEQGRAFPSAPDGDPPLG